MGSLNNPQVDIADLDGNGDVVQISDGSNFTKKLSVLVQGDAGTSAGGLEIFGLDTGGKARAPYLDTTGELWSDLMRVGGAAITLGQKAMAASLPVSMASDQVPPVNNVVTGTISAAGGTVTMTAQGWPSMVAVFTGAWGATLVVESSSDGGTTWVQCAFVVPPAVLTGMPVPVLSVAANGTYQILGLGAITNIRVRASAYSSGPVSVRLVASTAVPGVLGSFVSMQQNVAASIFNNSTANLAAGASFNGTSESTLGVAGIQVNCAASQPIRVLVQQSMDGTNWDITDTQVFESGQGDGRTFQATASFFKVTATNLGGITTTYLRLQVALCPVVEALPRSLTLNGKLGLAMMNTGWIPDPSSHLDSAQNRALQLDTARNLMTRSQCLTDEESFRTDFTANDLYTDLTGTCYFTNGSTVVAGVGTAFFDEVTPGNYVKLSTHADTAYARVAEVHADNRLTLESAYAGATASGTGRDSEWIYAVGAGGSVTQAASVVNLVSGTTSGSSVVITRFGDYLPIIVGFAASVTQRIANQEAMVGLSDMADHQAIVIFDGTDNTKVRLRSSFSALDVQETLAALPGGLTTAGSVYYQIEVLPNQVTLYANGTPVASHQLHVPGPYATLDCHAMITNTGVPASTTTLSLDTFFLTNMDRVEVGSTFKSSPAAVQLSYEGGVGVLSLPKMVDLFYNASDGAVVASTFKRVATYVIPAGYYGYLIKFASYQAESAASRLVAETPMGTHVESTNAFTAGSAYVPPQWASVVEAEVTTPYGAGSNCTITVTYTNETGVAGRTATFTIPKSSVVGTRFVVPPQAGDLGFRAITGVSGTPTQAGAIKLLGLLQLAFHEDQATTVQSETVYAAGAITFPTGTVLGVEYAGGTVSKQRTLGALIQLLAV